MVVSGSHKRWAWWHSPSPNWHHLYTTYSPCRTWGAPYATDPMTPCREFRFFKPPESLVEVLSLSAGKKINQFLGGGFKYFYFHLYLGKLSNLTIFFRWVETTNQVCFCFSGDFFTGFEGPMGFITMNFTTVWGICLWFFPATEEANRSNWFPPCHSISLFILCITFGSKTHQVVHTVDGPLSVVLISGEKTGQKKLNHH